MSQRGSIDREEVSDALHVMTAQVTAQIRRVRGMAERLLRDIQEQATSEASEEGWRIAA